MNDLKIFQKHKCKCGTKAVGMIDGEYFCDECFEIERIKNKRAKMDKEKISSNIGERRLKLK